jgi:hypothetical protein
MEHVIAELRTIAAAEAGDASRTAALALCVSDALRRVADDAEAEPLVAAVLRLAHDAHDVAVDRLVAELRALGSVDRMVRASGTTLGAAQQLVAALVPRLAGEPVPALGGFACGVLATVTSRLPPDDATVAALPALPALLALSPRIGDALSVLCNVARTAPGAQALLAAGVLGAVEACFDADAPVLFTTSDAFHHHGSASTALTKHAALLLANVARHDANHERVAASRAFATVLRRAQDADVLQSATFEIANVVAAVVERSADVELIRGVVEAGGAALASVESQALLADSTTAAVTLAALVSVASVPKGAHDVAARGGARLALAALASAQAALAPPAYRLLLRLVTYDAIADLGCVARVATALAAARGQNDDAAAALRVLEHRAALRADAPPEARCPSPRRAAAEDLSGREAALAAATEAVHEAQERLLRTLLPERGKTWWDAQPAEERRSLAALHVALTESAAAGADAPLRVRVYRACATLPRDVQAAALDRLAVAAKAPADQDSQKAQRWLTQMLQLPLNVFRPQPVSLRRDGAPACAAFLAKARAALDAALFGMHEAKAQVLQALAQRLACGGDDAAGAAAKGRGLVIALQGPPGIGKTALLSCVGAALGLPVVALSMCAIGDADALVGTGPAYVGARPGALATGLAAAGCMNPVIVIDEVDKLAGKYASGSQPLVNALLRMTDPKQNAAIHDAYFEQVPLDLSRAPMFFTCNDETAIDPVLANRLTVVRLRGYSGAEKATILARHLLPEALAQFGFGPADVVAPPRVVAHLLGRAPDPDAPGVRGVEHVVQQLLARVNLARLTPVVGGAPLALPLTLTVELVERLLDDDEGARREWRKGAAGAMYG